MEKIFCVSDGVNLFDGAATILSEGLADGRFSQADRPDMCICDRYVLKI